MRWLLRVVPVVLVQLCLVGIALASTPDTGPNSGCTHSPTSRLQLTIDRFLGTPGLLNARTDYIGARSGDVVPWYWIGSQFSVFRITRVDGCDGFDVLGWYQENGTLPVIDGLDDGVVFNGRGPGSRTADIQIPNGPQKFGFYLVVRHAYGHRGRSVDDIFFTNQSYDDTACNGLAVPQAFIYDVSRWKGPNSYLVCFEFIPGGNFEGPHCGTEEYAFQVTCPGATTPVATRTFGDLKATYR